MPSYNYPKTKLEAYDIELCRTRDQVKRLQNFTSYFPTYETADLPENLVNGQAFCTEEGKFCIYYDGSIYCMPAEPPFPTYATVVSMLHTGVNLGVGGEWGAVIGSTSSFSPTSMFTTNWAPGGSFDWYHQAYKRGDYSKILLSGYPNVVVEQSFPASSGLGPVVAGPVTLESPWSTFFPPSAVELPDGSFRMVIGVVSADLVEVPMGTVPPGLELTYFSHPWEIRVYDLPGGSYTVAGEGLSIDHITAPDDNTVHGPVNTYPIMWPWYSPDGNHFVWYRLNLKADLSDPDDRLNPSSNVRSVMLYNHSSGSSTHIQDWGSDLPFPEPDPLRFVNPGMFRWSPVGNHYVREVYYGAEDESVTANLESSLYGTIFSDSAVGSSVLVMFYETFRFSPDGEQIAFLRHDHSDASGLDWIDYYCVWVMNKDGSNLRRLSPQTIGGTRYNAAVGFHGTLFSIDWSPDGTQICAAAGFRTETGSGTTTYYIFDAVTGHVYPAIGSSAGFKVHSWQWGP
jgi:hypothetical protein